MIELKNLGKQTPHKLSGADAALLERVPNPFKNYPLLSGTVTIDGDEFTSICPVTSGPDHGRITIIYVPDQHLVESKSLKFYLESFRMEPIFHEKVVAKICNDLVELLNPFTLEVSGDFKPRGGWAIKPTARFTRK